MGNTFLAHHTTHSVYPKEEFHYVEVLAGSLLFHFLSKLPDTLQVKNYLYILYSLLQGFLIKIFFLHILNL